MIYSDQEAEICLDGFKLKNFGLYRGVRQGCPLCPLLFNLVIEILALAIQQQEIKGMVTTFNTHKLLLYEDDITFMLQDP